MACGVLSIGVAGPPAFLQPAVCARLLGAGPELNISAQQLRPDAEEQTPNLRRLFQTPTWRRCPWFPDFRPTLKRVEMERLNGVGP